MKITYQFVIENVEVDVEEAWGTILLNLDRHEYNNQQKETRRHTTLDNRVDEGEWLATEDKGLAELFTGKSDEQRVSYAISQLNPNQRELITAMFYENLTQEEYAKRKGISQQAVSKQIKIVLKILKILF